MSGVIDENGVQWEHCCNCSKLVHMHELGYQKPCIEFRYGRDLCVSCVDAGIRSGDINFEDIRPADSWVACEVEEDSTPQACHEFDDDAVCKHCGFDGAEWHHWRHNTAEGRALAEEGRAQQPPCHR